MLGTLATDVALDRPDLLAEPVQSALAQWPAAGDVLVAPIDPDLADTAAFCEAYGVGLDVSANCVVLAGKREGEVRFAACLVLATTRADVNSTARKLLEVRKVSFAPMAEAAAKKDGALAGADASVISSKSPEPGEAREEIRAHAAAAENVGNFFSDDIIVAVGALLLIRGFFETAGVEVRLRDIKGWSLPTAFAVLAIGWYRYRRLDARLKARKDAPGS